MRRRRRDRRKVQLREVAREGARLAAVETQLVEAITTLKSVHFSLQASRPEQYPPLSWGGEVRGRWRGS
jgi:hypothetical protein